MIKVIETSIAFHPHAVEKIKLFLSILFLGEYV